MSRAIRDLGDYGARLRKSCCRPIDDELPGLEKRETQGTRRVVGMERTKPGPFFMLDCDGNPHAGPVLISFLVGARFPESAFQSGQRHRHF